MENKSRENLVGIPANTDDGEIFQLDLTGRTNLNIIKEGDSRFLLKIGFTLARLKVPPVGRPGGANALLSVPFIVTEQGEGSIVTINGVSTGIKFLSADGDNGMPGEISVSFPIPVNAVEIDH